MNTNQPNDFNFDEFDKPASEWVDDTPELTPSTGENVGNVAGNLNTQQEAPHDTHSESLPDGITKLYSFRTLADLCKKPEPIRFLIEDHVQEEALHLDYGESGSGKSFVALDQALSIACEEIPSWHGMKIHHAPVIYLAGEGTKGLGKRCALWVQEHKVNPENIQFAIIDEVFKLDDETNIEHSIQNTIANIRAIYPTPGLIIIDTLHRYMSGDENKAVDISRYISACTVLMRELRCAIKTIHHVGNSVDSKGRPRGSSSLTADFDITTLYKKSGSTLSVDQTKNKDGVLRKGLKFTLKQGTLPDEWNNEDDKPTTSCTIELLSNTPEAETAKKLSNSQQRARKTFKKAVKGYGIRIHDEKSDHDLAGVYIEDWRTEAYGLDSADKEGTKRQHFNLDRKALFEDTGLLIKHIIEGREYYCLDMQADGEETFRIEVISALAEREKQQTETLAYLNQINSNSK